MKHTIKLVTGTTLLAAALLSTRAQEAVTVAVTPAPPKPPSVNISATAPAVAIAGDGEWTASGKGGNAAGHTLILPKDAADTKSLPEAEEDLKVMAHILEKAAAGRDERGHQAMGITLWNTRSGGTGAPRNLYLEGYGALFFLNVNFPLVAPPAKDAEAGSKENTSSEWEEARRELSQPTGSDFQFHMPELFGAEVGAEEFDADKVDDLKKNLITALKNAAHLRRLNSDETVTVIVTGRDANPRPKVLSRRSSGGGGGAAGGGVVYVPRATRTANDTRGSRLMLRARKSDIEAFQNGKTALDDFRKQVTVMVY